MRKIFLECIAVVSILILPLFNAAASQEQDKQRFIYLRWQSNGNRLLNAEQINSLNQLKNYPLYLYAKYDYLVNHIKTVSSQQITQFVDHYSNSPLADDLKRLYIWTLYKQKKWNTLITSPRDNSVQTQCYYYSALYNKTLNKDVLKPVKSIWLTGHALPAACDPLINVWEKTGQQTTDSILLRIALAIQEKNIDLARYLTKQLPPDNYKTIRITLLELLKNPKKLVNFANKIAASQFSKKIVLLSFPRLAKQNPNYALRVLPVITKKQQLSLKEINKLKEMIAWQFFSPPTTPTQITWRDDTIASIGNTALIERRIRQALREKNDNDLARWLNKLPKTAKNKDEWRYWQAILLARQGEREKANTEFDTLSKQQGFYAMLSAQKLGKQYNHSANYPIINDQLNKDTQKLLLERYNNHVVIKRIKELLHWGDNAAARREWLFFISRAENAKNLAELARFAHLQGWGAYSIQATIQGKLWNNWTERFPLAYIDIFKRALNNKDIPLSYSLAISRQESAFQPRVISPSGARGLMQLMPATAKEIARQIRGLNYSSADQLYEPKTNISLGTHFLEFVYQQFNKNRILSSVAYNAGPARAKLWLKETKGKLDAPTFIETIPFADTRNYVKRVLVYDYIYQLVLNHNANNLIFENEINRMY